MRLSMQNARHSFPGHIRSAKVPPMVGPSGGAGAHGPRSFHHFYLLYHRTNASNLTNSGTTTATTPKKIFNLQSGVCLALPHRQVKQERQLRLTKTGTTTFGRGMTLIPNNLPNTKAGAGLRVPRGKNTVTHGRKMGSARMGHYANLPPRTPPLMALRLLILMTLTLRALQTKWRKKIGHGQKYFKNKDQGPELTAPKGWDPDVERETLPVWRIREIRLCKHYWQIQNSTKGGCSRGDYCEFHHSSAHLNNYVMTLLTYVEKNEVIPGAPRFKSDGWVFRQNYPAPWPQKGISHLNQDGSTYSNNI